MPQQHYYQPVYTFNSCNPSLAIANQISFPRRFTSPCSCNSANTLCRVSAGLDKWNDPNSTSAVIPAIECQFCWYTVKRCPKKCEKPRKCHPIC